jgi:hypothetical protein
MRTQNLMQIMQVRRMIRVKIIENIGIMVWWWVALTPVTWVRIPLGSPRNRGHPLKGQSREKTPHHKKIASFFLNCLVRFTPDPRPLFRLFRLRKMIRASHPSGLRPCSKNLVNRPLANLAPESYRCHARVQLFFFKSNGC